MTAPGDYSLRTTPTFTGGAFMVANAIDDCLLIYRGSTCVAEHVWQTFDGHDLDHQLDPDVRGARLVVSGDPASASVMGSQHTTVQAAATALARREANVLLLAQLTRYVVMGESLSAIGGELAAHFDRPCVPLDATKVNRDFTGAFDFAMQGLAREVVERARDIDVRPAAAAVIGYMQARHGGDTEGDLGELRRLLAALGIDIESVWLAGEAWADLGRALNASTLLAFPYGAEAADILSTASGASVVSRPLPVSLGDTIEWLEAVAEATDTGERAKGFIESELRRIIPRLDRVVTRSLRGKRAIVVATPDWLPGIVRCFTEDLGIVVVGEIARQRLPTETGSEAPAPGDLDRTWDPSLDSLRHHVERARESGGLDFLVGSAWERSALVGHSDALPVLEFGYPQERAHFLRPTPHLGFEGVLTWANRVFDAVSPQSTRPPE